MVVDGEVIATDSQPDNSFIYTFRNIDVTKGNKAEAVAYDARNNEIGRDEIVRADTPAMIRLTPHTGKEGLLADGSDLMYFDVEVIDSNGNVCPLSYDKISFELSGDATFMGGYNSGFAKNKKSGRGAGETVIGKDYVYAECGVNRVFVKAGKTAGKISLKATLDGGVAAPVTVSVNSVEYPEKIVGGLTTHMQQSLDFGTMPEIIMESATPIKPLGKAVSVLKNDWSLSSFIYKVTDTIIEKDIYAVKLNGNVIATTNQSYKPDATTGVVTDAVPVLAAIKALGADFEYTVNTDGTVTMTSKKGQNGTDGNMHTFVIKKGQTAIGYDGDPEGILTNAEIEEVNGQLQLEIAALLSYIEGVSTSTDLTGKVLDISYSAN